MSTYLLNKLVRDNIPANQQETNQRPIYRKLALKDHTAALLDKLIEEAREIPLDNRKEAIKEIADVQQVIDDLIKILNISKQEIQDAQATKRERNGAFLEGYFVESVSPDDGSEWDNYYASEPSRFKKQNP